jgi:hypothetical protein
MGLDTVELIMKFEKFFKVSIPDKKAEKISTIEDATNYFLGVLNIRAVDTALKDSIANKVLVEMAKLGSRHSTINYSEHLRIVLANCGEDFIPKLSELISLEIHSPYNSNIYAKWKSKLFGASESVSNQFKDISFGDFIDGICGVNFRKLLSLESITSKYDVYICIIGMTHEQSGAEIYEISWQKSFTSDLGMD